MEDKSGEMKGGGEPSTCNTGSVGLPRNPMRSFSAMRENQDVYLEPLLRDWRWLLNRGEKRLDPGPAKSALPFLERASSIVTLRKCRRGGLDNGELLVDQGVPVNFSPDSTDTKRVSIVVVRITLETLGRSINWPCHQF